MDLLAIMRESLECRNLIFVLRGPMNHEILEVLAENVKAKMDSEHVSFNVIMKVFSVFVELARNIINYSSDFINVDPLGISQMRTGMLVIGMEDGQIYIASGNRIDKSLVERLHQKLSVVTKLDKEELKAHYKAQRQKERERESKGGGLGFIEIARKASSMEYEIREMDENYAFFYIKAAVDLAG